MDGNFSKRFVFDLQRFTAYTLTQDGSTYKLSGGSGGDKTATKLSDLFTSSNVTSSDTVTVNGTITISADDTIDFQGATINGSIASGAVFNVTGGTVNMTNGTVRATRSDGEAEVSAINVQSGATVNLGNTKDNSAKAITIDGAGTTGTPSSLGVVLYGGTLNVNKNATVTSNNDCAIWYNANNGAVVVDGGTVEVTSANTNTAISMRRKDDSGQVLTGGTLEIKDGTVAGNSAAAIYTRNNSTLTISGGTAISNNESSGDCTIALGGDGVTFNMSGGKVESANAMGYCTISMSGLEINASNYTLTITGGEIASTSNREGYSNAAMQIGVDNGNPKGAKSITVKDCTITSANGQGIMLYDDCTLDNVTINAKTYGIYTAKQAPTVTLTNSTITSSGSNYAGIYTQDGNFTIGNGTTITGEGYYGILQYAGTKGKITVEDGASISAKNYGIYSSEGTVEIKGGTVKCTNTSGNSFGVYNVGTSALSFSGGTISGCKYSGIYNTSSKDFTISDNAKIENSAYGVMHAGTGKLTMSGGTILSNNNAGVYAWTGTTEISGGTINSGTAVSVAKGTGTLAITGGTYNSGVSDYVTDGNLQAQIGDNYIVAAKSSFSTGWTVASDTEWDYIVVPETGKVATTPATLKGSGSILTLTTATTGETTIPLNIGTLIPSNTTYTTLDASTATLPLNITGDSKITAITGGAGNDALTAGSSASTLDGGAGSDTLTGSTAADSLKGGDGNDLFVVNGSDTIADYAAGDVIQFSADPTNVEVDGTNVKFTVGSNTIVAQAARGLDIVTTDSTTYKTYSPVAQIGENKFYTLADAVKAGGEIKLLASVGEAITVPASTTATIDLNGFKITGNITATGNLTLSDDTGNGTVDGSITGDNVTITGGIYTTDVSAKVAANTAKSFYYQADNKSSLYVGEKAIANLSDKPSLTIDGSDVAYYETDALRESAKSGSGNLVASIGDSKFYTTFAKAMAAAQSGDTIKLLQSPDATTAVTVSEDVTVDLNGKTIKNTFSVSGNLNVVDTAGGGSISTSDDAINVLSGGSFNLFGGTVTSTGGSAVVNSGGTVNIRGGSLRAEKGHGINNATVNSYLNMWGGLVFGKVGIKMLAGFLSLLGGRVHGKGNKSNATPSNGNNVVDNAEVVENYAITESGDGGVGIDVAPSGNVEVTVGDKDNKTDIEVSGTNSALAVGDGESGTTATSTISLNDGKYSAGELNESTGEITANEDGAAINYNGTNDDNKLTVDGAILESKVTTNNNTNVGNSDTATDGTANQIVIRSVAVNSTAASGSATSVSSLLGAASNFNGGEYQFVGNAKDFYAVKVIPAQTEPQNVSENVVEYADTNEEDTLGTNYGSLKDAALAASVGATLQLLDNIDIGSEVTFNLSSGTGTINLDFNEYKLTYGGEGNAAISLGSGVALSLSNDGLFNGGIEVTGETPNISVAGATFDVLKLTTSDNKNTYFYNFNSAMNRLDQSTETLTYAKDFSLADGVLAYNKEAEKTFRLEGITNTKDVSITAVNGATTFENFNISLTAANFKDATVANGGNYKFNLSTAENGGASSFTGSGGKDTITNAIANLTINGGAGNDSIVNNGASAYIDGGEGNDIITNSVAGASLFGGDGDDTLEAGTLGAYLDGGAGKDSLKGGNGDDTFVYSGGEDTIDSYGTGNDVVKLSDAFKPITNGNNISSTDGGLILNFGEGDSLQVNATSVVSLQSGSENYFYTSTAVSVTGSGSSNAVTLGKDYNGSEFTVTGFTTINAAAVSPAGGSFTIAGDSSTANYIVGSNNVATSILGGEGNDTLKAGTAGATLNGGTSGADVLIGSAAVDSIYANGAATINAGLGANKISLGSGASGALIKVSDGSDLIQVSDGIAFSVQGFDSTDSIYFASSTISETDIGFNGSLFTVKSDSNTVSISGLSAGTTDMWIFDSDNIASHVSRTISDAASAYSIEGGNTLVFKGKVTDTATGIKLGGLQTTDGIVVESISVSDKGVSLGADNFGENGASIASASTYKFSLTGGDYNSTFTGSSGADSIYNAGSALLINGGAGNDYIKNASGDNVTLNGGAGNDTLVGSSAAETFVYTAGKDSIGGYSAGDIILTTLDPITDISKVTVSDNTYTFNFGSNNTLTVASTTNVPVSVKSSDGDTYVYGADYIAKNTEGVTLTKAITSAGYNPTIEYSSIDGSAITAATSINGNNKDNYIIGSSTAVNSLFGGAGADSLIAGKAGAYLDGGEGNDSLIGGAGKDTFVYNGGNDVIQSYTDGSDTVIVMGDDITLPTSFTANSKTPSLSYDNSNYVLTFDANNSLTFVGKNVFSIAKGNDTYSYTSKSIAINEDAITLGPSYTSNFNGANAKYVTINGAELTKAIRITGNDSDNTIIGGTGGGTLVGGGGADILDASKANTSSIGTFLNGGDGNDTLIGGNGKDTFAYTGGNDVIQSYTFNQDLVNVAAGIDVTGVKVESVESDNGTNNLVLGFDSGNSLTFAGGATSTISLKSGRNYYTFQQDRFALDKSITLTAGYADSIFNAGDDYNNINASLVGQAISIKGNDNGNYIIGSATKASSLVGGKGDDTFLGGSGNDVFFYGGGKDVIQNFGAADSLSIATDNIAKARASSRRLTFTMTDKNNTLVFRSDDSIPAKISLTDDGYLTKDGVVKDESLKLFSSAKGRIELTDTLYSAASITAVDASTVKSQSVTLVGGSQGGAFTFAGINKKRDGFEYGGGAVSISNYESGKDRINLLNESIAGFSIVGDETTGNDVVISLSSSDSSKFISLKGAQGSEVLIHQSTNKGNSYSKMVFADTGVLYDKAKAMSATLSTGARNFDASNSSVPSTLRKITVGAGVQDISITAGNSKNTVIDASNASGAVSLISGAKNDKFTGSAFADTFVYTKGKDILQGFDATDSISLGNATLNTSEAKITANKKSIKFKFGTKDVLTVKPTKGDTLSGELNINGDTRTYGKNSIADSGNVTLTSKFGGTYNIDKSGGSTIDGHLVSKKLTIKGTDAAESLRGGSGKTMFKGGGGPNSGAAADTLVGGSGKDTFFYAKGDKGNVTIEDFDFTNDKLKIAGGTLAKVSTVSGGVQFAMKNGKGDSPEIGTFNVTSSATYDKNGKAQGTVNTSNTLIHVNNTYYWFATGDETVASEDDTLTAGALITSVNKISSSQTKGYDIIELNYSTNLLRSNVAVQVKDTLKPSSNT